MSDQTTTFVWIFSGANRHFPGGVFTNRDVAEAWIGGNRLTGTLTLYPVDVGLTNGPLPRGFSGPASRTNPARSSSADSRTPEWNMITTTTVYGVVEGSPE